MQNAKACRMEKNLPLYVRLSTVKINTWKQRQQIVTTECDSKDSGFAK